MFTEAKLADPRAIRSVRMKSVNSASAARMFAAAIEQSRCQLRCSTQMDGSTPVTGALRRRWFFILQAVPKTMIISGGVNIYPAESRRNCLITRPSPRSPSLA